MARNAGDWYDGRSVQQKKILYKYRHTNVNQNTFNQKANDTMGYGGDTNALNALWSYVEDVDDPNQLPQSLIHCRLSKNRLSDLRKRAVPICSVWWLYDINGALNKHDVKYSHAFILENQPNSFRAIIVRHSVEGKRYIPDPNRSNLMVLALLKYVTFFNIKTNKYSFEVDIQNMKGDITYSKSADLALFYLSHAVNDVSCLAPIDSAKNMNMNINMDDNDNKNNMTNDDIFFDQMKPMDCIKLGGYALSGLGGPTPDVINCHVIKVDPTFGMIVDCPVYPGSTGTVAITNDGRYAGFIAQHLNLNHFGVIVPFDRFQPNSFTSYLKVSWDKSKTTAPATQLLRHYNFEFGTTAMQPTPKGVVSNTTNSKGDCFTTNMYGLPFGGIEKL